MDAKRTVLPLRFATEQEDQAALPKQEIAHYSAGPEDADAGKKHELVNPNAHISEKTYWLPDSFNALRREMDENWPNLFKSVGWPMAFDAPTFIEMMDAALDTKTTFDTAKVDSICKKYLDLLRNKRGLSSLHTHFEKAESVPSILLTPDNLFKG
jgi:trans-aconitate methyltransferase